ncbi:hypothetical protein BDZ91DRAFT_721681 [Kalaharituber pfeilii]|nr:hypothetical protein BDZ91DRAFT_721681 [Kalaharituber pfeilii]
MAQELTVPSVTWEQIDAFRQKHFSAAAHSAFFTPFLPSSQTDSLPTFPHSNDDASITYNEYGAAAEEEEYAFEDYGEEDPADLGYYPDGTKRTLTDAQIAIFRHTEIQEMLKAQRNALRSEAEAAAAKAEAEAEASTNDTSPPLPAPITEDYSTHDPRSRPMAQDTSGSVLPWDDDDVDAWEQVQQAGEERENGKERKEGREPESALSNKRKSPPTKIPRPAVRPTYDAPSGKQFFWPVIEK